MNATTLALAASYSGMTGLCLAMDRHFGQAWGRDTPPALRRALQVAGALLLALGLAVCVGAWPAAIGVVAWCGFLSAGALALVLLLPYAPRFASGLAAVSAVVAVAGVGLSLN